MAAVSLPPVWPLMETRLGRRIDDLAHGGQQLLGVGHGFGGALLEHGAAVLVDQLDAQALRGLLQHHLMGQIGDVGIVLDRLTDRFGGMGEFAVLGRRCCWRCCRLVLAPVAPPVTPLASDFTGEAGEGGDCFCITDWAPPAWADSSPITLPPSTPPEPETVWAMDCGREIVGDAALLFRRGGVDQPHQTGRTPSSRSRSRHRRLSRRRHDGRHARPS